MIQTSRLRKKQCEREGKAYIMECHQRFNDMTNSLSGAVQEETAGTKLFLYQIPRSADLTMRRTVWVDIQGDHNCGLILVAGVASAAATTVGGLSQNWGRRGRRRSRRSTVVLRNESGGLIADETLSQCMKTSILKYTTDESDRGYRQTRIQYAHLVSYRRASRRLLTRCGLGIRKHLRKFSIAKNFGADS